MARMRIHLRNVGCRHELPPCGRPVAHLRDAFRGLGLAFSRLDRLSFAMGRGRFGDQEIVRRAKSVMGRVARVVLSTVALGIGLLALWGGVRALGPGPGDAMGWALVVLGAGSALVGVFFLVWLNSRTSLARRNAYSVDAAIARAEEHDRLGADGSNVAKSRESIDRRVPAGRRVAVALLASSMLVMISILLYGVFASGPEKVDVAWVMLTIAGVLLLAALPLVAIWRPLE